MSAKADFLDVSKRLSPESLEALAKVADIVRSDTKNAVSEVSVIFEITLVDDGCGSLADDLARICEEEGGKLRFAAGETEVYSFE